MSGSRRSARVPGIARRPAIALRGRAGSARLAAGPFGPGKGGPGLPDPSRRSRPAAAPAGRRAAFLLSALLLALGAADVAAQTPEPITLTAAPASLNEADFEDGTHAVILSAAGGAKKFAGRAGGGAVVTPLFTAEGVATAAGLGQI